MHKTAKTTVTPDSTVKVDYIAVWDLAVGEYDPLGVVVADVWRVTGPGNQAQSELTLQWSW